MTTIRFTRGEISFSQHLPLLAEVLSPQELKIVKTIHQSVLDHPIGEAINLLETSAIRTAIVVHSLKKLARKLGYEARWSKNKHGKWLVDFEWMIKREKSWLPRIGDSNSWANFDGLKLACVCQWIGHSEAVLGSFLKLTVIKAECRLFIHTNGYTTFDKDTSIVDYCKAALKYSTGERYLFIGFDHERKNAEFRVDLIQA